MDKPAIRDTKAKWEQDKVQRPYIPRNATLNPYYVPLRRMHTVYVHDITLPNGAFGVYERSHALDLNRTFYICNVVLTAFDSAAETTIPQRPGFVSVIDNSVQYPMFDSVPSGLLITSALIVQPQGLYVQQNSYSQPRTILPNPYGISPGGSFTTRLEIPSYAPNLIGMIMQINVEGFWDFDFA